MFGFAACQAESDPCGWVHKRDSVFSRMCSHLRVNTQSSTQQGKGYGCEVELESGPALLHCEGSHGEHKHNRVGQSRWGSQHLSTIWLDDFLPVWPRIQHDLGERHRSWDQGMVGEAMVSSTSASFSLSQTTYLGLTTKSWDFDMRWGGTVEPMDAATSQILLMDRSNQMQSTTA